MTGEGPIHHHGGPSLDSSHRVEPTVGDLLDRVRSAGGRVTSARHGVLQVLLEAGPEHLSAEEVADRVHTTAPDVHLSTIYRTLESLEEMGILNQARLGEGPASYHLASDRHHHAVCSTCGAVIDLPGETFVPITRRLAQEHGFVADPNHLTISGTCATCAASASS